MFWEKHLKSPGLVNPQVLRYYYMILERKKKNIKEGKEGNWGKTSVLISITME